MKKKSMYLIFLISLLIFIPKVKATCSYSRLSDLKKLASNVNVTYTYTINDNKATFDIKFANLTNDIYLYDSLNDKKYNQVGEIVLKNYSDGIKYRFFIKSNDNDCKDEVLMTKYVTLPKYNIYYGNSLCEGIEDYALCQRWGSFSVNNYEEYETQIKKYKSSLVKKESNIENKEEETFFDKVTDFLYDYYIFILSGIIIIGLIIIYYLYKKDKFNF